MMLVDRFREPVSDGGHIRYFDSECVPVMMDCTQKMLSVMPYAMSSEVYENDHT
jgi:hypothetical protein